MNKARQAAQTVSAIELTVSDGTEWLVQGKVFNGPEKVYTVKNAPKLGREQVGEVFIELGEEQGEHVYYRHLLARTLLKKYYQGTLEREPDCEFILLSLPAGYRLYCRIAQEKTVSGAMEEFLGFMLTFDSLDSNRKESLCYEAIPSLWASQWQLLQQARPIH